jgi:hypothetical protein
MPRLVHLARASNVRTIERAGIRGGTAAVLDVSGRASRIERAVFAMPLVRDFSVTYQWLRELRRWHGERMVAVHFVLPSDEQVLIGRYNGPHERLALRDAARRALRSPMGSEIVVMRSVRRREVIAVRQVTQLVGWTQVPEPGAKLDCLCVVCVPSGTRDLMRRVRASFSRHLADARRAKSPKEVVAALRSLDVPLERARGRIPPDKLLAFAKAESADVRRALAWLLGYFGWADVEAPLVRLVDDADERVRASALESLVRSGGVRRAYDHVRDRDESVLELVDYLELASDVVVSTRLLSLIAARDDGRIRDAAGRAAAALLRDDALDAQTRAQLECIVSSAT